MSLPFYLFILRLSVKKAAKPEVYLPKSLFEPFPSTGSFDKPRSGTKIENDWRHGSIQIDWLDIHEMDTNVRSRRTGNPVAKLNLSNKVIKTGGIELSEGVVHIFRENNLKSNLTEADSLDDGSTSQGILLAVLAVPPYMTPADFLNFVAPAAEAITHLRMIRDSSPNRSMVLIKFRGAIDAADFAEAFNGKSFNSMASEICQVVYIKSVSIEAHDESSLANARLSSALENVHELPSCPVCLERMDSSVTGLVTIPCLHTFHCTCLTKWGDSRCPVCRYSQNIMPSHRPSVGSSTSSAGPHSPSVSSCWDCSSITNLWICLICGNIGCGRYGRAHAQSHYQATTHVYALELETQRVWDYAGDGYVHRLIQNKADGKLVELPSASMSFSIGATPNSSRTLGPSNSDNLTAEKIEAIGIEYSYLLTSQLDSQREYFEKEMACMKEEFAKTQSRILEDAETRLQELSSSAEREMKERQRLEKKAEQSIALARQLRKELREERAVNEGMMQNLTALKDKLETSEREKSEFNSKVTDLEEQLRDMMFFLDAKDKISRNDELTEAAGGSIQIAPSPTVRQSNRRGRRKG